MVWQPLKIQTGLRQLKELRTGVQERRGRPRSYDDDDLIGRYIEIQALARHLTEGAVLTVLRHPNLRVTTADGRQRRLNQQDRQRLRRQYAKGKREAEVWRDTEFVGRPHPRWAEIQRAIEARVTQLQSSPRSDYFFSK